MLDIPDICRMSQLSPCKWSILYQGGSLFSIEERRHVTLVYRKMKKRCNRTWVTATGSYESDYMGQQGQLNCCI